jgi:hypothetical protein
MMLTTQAADGTIVAISASKRFPGGTWRCMFS